MFETVYVCSVLEYFLPLRSEIAYTSHLRASRQQTTYLNRQTDRYFKYSWRQDSYTLKCFGGGGGEVLGHSANLKLG
jgi:hypothetical protein